MKTILLAVTGMSPQVITETLWAIHRNSTVEPWPAEIHIITTRLGALEALRGLKEDGHLTRLCGELDMPEPAFHEGLVHIVPDSAGKQIDDARSREDHEALADFIMRKVAELAQDADVRIHASLAGGRKTMTYYFGYAMSLFGRPQDNLTHVLVSEGYEGLKDFYYPSRQQPPITNRLGTQLNPADAEIVLADIPFVRLSETLSPAMRKLAVSMTFRKLVELLNLASQKDQIRIMVDMPNQSIHIGRQRGPTIVTIYLKSKTAFALFTVLVRAHMEGDHSIQRCQRDTLTGKPRPDRGLAGEIINQLAIVCGVVLPGDVNRLEDKIDILGEEYVELHEPILNRTLVTISRHGGIVNEWLDPNLTQIRQRLQEQLPLPLARLLEPVGMRVNDAGTLVEAKGDDSAYRFHLDPEQFGIVDQ